MRTTNVPEANELLASLKQAHRAIRHIRKREFSPYCSVTFEGMTLRLSEKTWRSIRQVLIEGEEAYIAKLEADLHRLGVTDLHEAAQVDDV